MYSSDTIAWLVPTANSTPAHKATLIPSNSHLTIPISSNTQLSSLLSSFASTPTHALQLSFSSRPKHHGRFTIGTDPLTCDVVLPPLPGISPQHCYMSFDAEARLTLEDVSQRGTQVWYDWESKGDQTDYTWTLGRGAAAAPANTRGGFPNNAQRIIIDIQSVRFQVVLSNHSSDRDAYARKVEEFCETPSWSGGLAAAWVGGVCAPMAQLCSSVPMFHHIYVKNLGEEHVGEFYMWDLARPWEALVKVTA